MAVIKEHIKEMANNLRRCADYLDRVAERVEGADSDEMIVDPMKALDITTAFAGRVVGFCADADQFEIDLFGAPPPSLPASQMSAGYYETQQPPDSEPPSSVEQKEPPRKKRCI